MKKPRVCLLLAIILVLSVSNLTAGSNKKILFEISGIGNGHCSRQLPIMEHLLEQGHQIMVFTGFDEIDRILDAL